MKLVCHTYPLWIKLSNSWPTMFCVKIFPINMLLFGPTRLLKFKYSSYLHAYWAPYSRFFFLFSMLFIASSSTTSKRHCFLVLSFFYQCLVWKKNEIAPKNCLHIYYIFKGFSTYTVIRTYLHAMLISYQDYFPPKAKLF